MDTIIYHGGCPDGWCSAYVASKKYPDAVMIPATHGNPPPFEQCRDRRVLVVDFSWKRELVEQLATVTKDLVILDHHKTAEKELEGLPYCEFDMTRSGAAMAWDFLFPLLPRPWYVDYVMDRDLWTWKLPNSRAISAYIMALPMTVKDWDRLDMMTKEQVGGMGDGIVQHINHYTEKVTEQHQAGTWLGQLEEAAPGRLYNVRVVNAAYPNISEVCNVLCEQGADIGLGWFQRGDGMIQFSLRSIGNIDVSQMAKIYGGGGHKNAAGFQLPWDEAVRFIRSILG